MATHLANSSSRQSAMPTAPPCPPEHDSPPSQAPGWPEQGVPRQRMLKWVRGLLVVVLLQFGRIRQLGQRERTVSLQEEDAPPNQDAAARRCDARGVVAQANRGSGCCQARRARAGSSGAAGRGVHGSRRGARGCQVGAEQRGCCGRRALRR
ncbi:hypothetical protein PVAP13_4NG206100 [Panicum virgatum]|uniref:Uncharacterized protein n=1 Tax=Panicum virgatum TaxID=38727 RepID=A0A8T0T3F8_PANVG|nr:hypothetical protein PVAP13_4NG206100 [Panicum virgatum]